MQQPVMIGQLLSRGSNQDLQVNPACEQLIVSTQILVTFFTSMRSFWSIEIRGSLSAHHAGLWSPRGCENIGEASGRCGNPIFKNKRLIS